MLHSAFFLFVLQHSAAAIVVQYYTVLMEERRRFFPHDNNNGYEEEGSRIERALRQISTMKMLAKTNCDVNTARTLRRDFSWLRKAYYTLES